MRGSLDLRDPGLLHDLIGRPPRVAAASNGGYEEDVVLVTGAGGSVGSEIARHLAARRVARLVILDSSEYALFRIEQEIRARFPSAPIAPVLGDVSRRRAMDRIFAEHRPSVTFHAAAYKHVGMLERDVRSAVRTNVFGSLNVAAAARTHDARFLLVSSDKAANPRSVMGASKRLAELSLPRTRPGEPGTAVVRFGNVAGSSGSVLEVMLERIRAGQPVQVTDPAATRYFMTGGEAAALVLAADRLRGAGDIFWLEMGEPVAILDLARRLTARALAAGLPEVPIEFIGLRPGEKLREELTVQGLELTRTACDGIWIARQAPTDGAHVRRCLEGLHDALRRGLAVDALALLERAVPEYRASPDARLAAEAADAARYRPAGVCGRRLDTRRHAFAVRR